MQNSKRCPKCDTEKQADQFDKCLGGLSSYCKPCRQEYKRLARRGKYGYYASEDKDKSIKLKRIVIGHYSCGTMVCSQCGFSDMRALSIDHVNGDGAEHRRAIAGAHMYRWLKSNEFPTGFQVLCMNCQFIKRHEKKEFGQVLTL